MHLQSISNTQYMVLHFSLATRLGVSAGCLLIFLLRKYTESPHDKRLDAKCCKRCTADKPCRDGEMPCSAAA